MFTWPFSSPVSWLLRLRFVVSPAVFVTMRCDELRSGAAVVQLSPNSPTLLRPSCGEPCQLSRFAVARAARQLGDPGRGRDCYSNGPHQINMRDAGSVLDSKIPLSGSTDTAAVPLSPIETNQLIDFHLQPTIDALTPPIRPPTSLPTKGPLYIPTVYCVCVCVCVCVM